MNYRKFLALPIAMIMMFATAPVFAVDLEELERRLNIMSEELDEVTGSGGSAGLIPGPGRIARRLGGLGSRTYINGYGETHYNTFDDGVSKMDQHRFVLGVYSELTDWINLNIEMDFEHAMTELEFEFGYLDFMVSEALNFRAGTLLMPMGNINEYHEPNRFYSVERPNFHKYLIPTSWSQGGAGIFGSSGDITYRVYATNAVVSTDATRYFDDKYFIRKGRAQLNAVTAADIALTGRLEQKAPGGQLGFSFYTGDSTNGKIEQGGRTTLLVADYKTKRGAFEYNFGILKGWIEDTEEINAWMNADPEAAGANDVPESAFGLLAELAIHLPEFRGVNTIQDWIAFTRYELIRPNDNEGDGATSTDPTKNFHEFNVGLAWKPIPRVAVKSTYWNRYYEGKVSSISDGVTASGLDFAVAYQF
jgi:hypothetical protein